MEAIKAGNVARYVTDFPNDITTGVKNVISIPHLGASTEEAEDNCAVMAVNQLKDFLENGHITNSVNFPSCQLERSGESRITICNSNVPSIIGKITTVLADANLNITEMVNKSRGELAYNIVDFNGEAVPDLEDRIRAVQGVIRARLI